MQGGSTLGRALLGKSNWIFANNSNWCAARVHDVQQSINDNLTTQHHTPDTQVICDERLLMVFNTSEVDTTFRGDSNPNSHLLQAAHVAETGCLQGADCHNKAQELK